MLPKKKNLSTELKDLDVDRVDGVDRPATGRAFVLFKSEGDFHDNDDAAHIAAVLKKLMPTADDVVKSLVAQAIEVHVIKCTNAAGEIVGYQVRGTDVASPLYKTLPEAAALVERVIRGEIAEGRRKAGVPVDPEDLPITPGAVAAMTDPAVNADPNLARQKKPGLW